MPFTVVNFDTKTRDLAANMYPHAQKLANESGLRVYWALEHASNVAFYTTVEKQPGTVDVMAYCDPLPS